MASKVSVPPKKKKQKRSENAVEATVSLRLNSSGALVDYECGNPDCTESLGESEEQEFGGEEIKIEAGEEVECGACGTINFNEGFVIKRV